MLVGYARVSTEDQNNNAQVDALKAAGCGVIHQEKKSGGTMNRPILKAMLQALQPGDVVVVYKLDRVARSLKDLLFIQEQISQAGAEFKSLTEALETVTPAGRMIFQILGAFAEFERSLIRERTKVGLQAAMERGSKPGQPRSMTPEQESMALEQWQSGAFTKTSLATQYSVHISSIKRMIKRANLSQKRTAPESTPPLDN